MCGSDGVLYDNHCALHRAACQLARPVSPLHPAACRTELLRGEEVEEELEVEEVEEEQDQSPAVLPSKS